MGRYGLGHAHYLPRLVLRSRVRCTLGLAAKGRFDFEKSNLRNFAESADDMVEKTIDENGRP